MYPARYIASKRSNSKMVDFMMTIFAYGQCLLPFCYHRNLPKLFSLEVLHFVYVVHFELCIRFATQLAGIGRQPFFKSCPRSRVPCRVINYYIAEFIIIFAVCIFRESAIFLLPFRGVVWYAPATVFDVEFANHLPAGALVFSREGFQAAVFH